MNDILQLKILNNTVQLYIEVFGFILIALIIKRIISKYLAALLFRLFTKKEKQFRKKAFIELIVSPLDAFIITFIIVITLDKLASVACLNSVYFLREFKKYFGLSPRQYIIQQRLSIAKKLMQTTSLSITEICFEVGYSDVTSFGKLFKKYFFHAPAAFRLNTMKKSFFTC